MRPAPRLVGLAAAWTVAGLVTVWQPAAAPAWLAAGGFLLTAAVLDARALRRRQPPVAVRRVPAMLPLGVWTPVSVRLRNPESADCRLQVFDHYPQPGECADLPQTVTVAGHGWTELRYRFRPLQRGERPFGPVQALLQSPFGLWRRDLRLAAPFTVRVYPDFAAIAHYALLAASNRVSALGIQRRRRRGEGQDFHQLREYRDGDSLRQIDWNATARLRKLISKEYREQRDQTVVFLLDCSRRMWTRDGALSHFDHALNAMILLAYVALRQGDAVGFQSFGGEARWLPPRKGGAALNTLINAVYDLQPTLHAADYGAATDLLATRQRKRALVLLLTELRDEDLDDLQPAVALLSRRHLLVVAALRERVLDDTLAEPVADFTEALRHGAVCHYLQERERALEQLRRCGATVLDVQPNALPAAMVNQYLELKRSGRL